MDINIDINGGCFSIAILVYRRGTCLVTGLHPYAYEMSYNLTYLTMAHLRYIFFRWLVHIPI